MSALWPDHDWCDECQSWYYDDGFWEHECDPENEDGLGLGDAPDPTELDENGRCGI